MNEILQIWNSFIQARNILYLNGLIRSYNNPIEDFSEWLVANVVNGHLAANINQQDYDVQNEHYSIQVKSIAKAPNNPNGYIVSNRDRQNQLATHYAFVFYNEYVPATIYITNSDFVRDFHMSQIKRNHLDQQCPNIVAITEQLSVKFNENDFSID